MNDRIKSKKEREEDMRFLLDQRGDRKMCLGGFSSHYEKAFTAKIKRELVESKKN